MRICVCTKRDLPALIALNHLVRGLLGHEVHVLLSEVCRQQESDVPELQTIKEFEREIPNGLLFPQVDAMTEPPGDMLTFQHLARRYGVQCRSVTAINSGDGRRLLDEMSPDLIISVRFSHIFHDEVIDLPPLGILNVHPGTLPRYAGLFAPFWSLTDGEDWIGSTVHWIDRGVDTGPIIGIGRLPVRRERSLVWHVAHAYPPGIDIVLMVVRALADGSKVPTLPQERALRNYRSLPSTADFAAFANQGWDLVQPADYDELHGAFSRRTTRDPDQGLFAPVG